MINEHIYHLNPRAIYSSIKLCCNKFLIVNNITNFMATKEIFRNIARKDAAINEQRKKLQELRLQTESENTKLLKIQQKEREVEAEYQNEKRKMEETLAKLTVEAEGFMSKQTATTQEFEIQKEQIFTNDRKKDQSLKQVMELEMTNAKKREEIREKEKRLASKKEKLAEIRAKIKRHHIYEDFLKEVKELSEDFNTGEFDEFSVMTILERYQTMDKKKQELSEVHRKLETEKENKARMIQQAKKIKEEKIMEYNARIKELKQSIDNYHEETLQIESDLESKLNENIERQRELGQVIFSIQGLYQQIVGEERQKKKTLEMLQVIKEERRKLKEYLDLYHRKTEEKKG